MVEEPRDIRDRGFLATMLCTGIIALAVGLFQIFIGHLFGPLPIFDALLGVFMILVGLLFVAPYMAPRLVGLPAPGVQMLTRPYLPYPVPVPDGLVAGPRSVPSAPAPSDDWDEVPAPTGRTVLPSRAPPARAAKGSAVTATPPALWRTSEAGVSSADIAALEEIANAPASGAHRPSVVVHTPPPLKFREIIPRVPPPAEYLESDDTPVGPTPEVEPNVQRALHDLEGLSGQGPHDARPLTLIETNGGSQATDSTLQAMQELLLQRPPEPPRPNRLEELPPPIPPTPVPDPSPMEEVEHLHADLQPFHPLTPAADHPILPTLTPPAGEPERPEFDLVLPPTAPPSVTTPEPVLPAAPTPAPAAPPAVEAPRNVGVAPSPRPSMEVRAVPEVGEAELSQITEALDGLISSARAPAPTTPAPPPVLPPTAETTPPVAPAAVPITPEEFHEESEPHDGQGVDEIEDIAKQLAAMRSALVQEPRLMAPPAGRPVAPSESDVQGALTKASKLNGTTLAPGAGAGSTEDELQDILEDAQSAAKLAAERHKVPERPKKPVDASR